MIRTIVLAGTYIAQPKRSPCPCPCPHPLLRGLNSKNWHTDSTAAYWAGFDGYWWTANSLLRLPPSSTISLSLALSYERYGGVPAWSHAQLSIVGYSDKWLWEQAALGSGGENICFDPLGSHTRAFITDVRPKLFDGLWKENVGGGDFVQLFGADGKLKYMKEMDPQLHSNGPCLSKAEYKSVTLDDSISSRVTISGGRTDDLVRVFVDIRLQVLKDTSFSRLFFFQQTSETYSYRATHERFVWGGAAEDGGSWPQSTSMDQVCTVPSGGTENRKSNKLYETASAHPFRQAMTGTAPWWFAFEGNTDSFSGDMVVGDRGLVIRKFSARLGGEEQASPAFSVLCDKFELGTPSGLLALNAGDYVNISLEILVLPRTGDEYNKAVRESWTARGEGAERLTLRDHLYGMTTSERVRAQAVGGELLVTAIRDARVEDNYPVRVVATAGGNAMFEVQSKDASALAAVMGDWCIGNVKQDGRYCCASSCGDACGSGSNCWLGGEAGSCCTTTIQAPCLTESQHTCVNPAHESVAPLHAPPLGFVPVVISGLTTYAIPAGQGLWLRPHGTTSFTLLTQGSGNEFWQANFNRASGTYEVVYNVEFVSSSTTVAFGSDPSTWATSAPTSSPSVGGASSATGQGDPHVYGGHGERYDFKGGDKIVYGVLSTPTLAANVRFELDTFFLGGTCGNCATKTVHGSFMKELYAILTTDTKTSIMTKFSVMSPSTAQHSLLPSGELKVSQISPSADEIAVDNVKVRLERINTRETHFSASDGQFTIVAKCRMYPWAERNRR